jgi:hypothetical protein
MTSPLFLLLGTGIFYVNTFPFHFFKRPICSLICSFHVLVLYNILNVTSIGFRCLTTALFLTTSLDFFHAKARLYESFTLLTNAPFQETVSLIDSTQAKHRCTDFSALACLFEAFTLSPTHTMVLPACPYR